VLDRGAGIPPDTLPHIFERFRRGTRTKGGQGGAGLGLAIALAIVEAHGGTIAAESRPGGGTTMTIRLPLGGASGEDARGQGSLDVSLKR
jgi:two-component system sensor histidine kinase BaeS